MPRISNVPARVPPRVTTSAAPAPRNVAKPQATNRPQAAFDATYWSELEDLAQRPPAQATDVVFLREHDAAWDARMQLIRESRTAIWGSFYIVNADRRGFELFEELIAARRRGVDVCVALDSIASLATSIGDKREDKDRLKSLIETLQAEGGGW